MAQGLGAPDAGDMRPRRATLGALLAALLAGCAAPGAAPGSTTSATTATTATTAATTSPRETGTTGASSPATTTRAVPTTATRPTTLPTTVPTTARPSPTAVGRLRVGGSAWVAVSVATLWRSPASPRQVDQPALRNPAGIRAWLSAMSDAQRRGLNGRADTQALLGDRVVVTALSGSWAKVVVPDQPTPLDGRGYPGWVPTVQLTAVQPAAGSQVATVVSRTAWLRTDDADQRSVVEVSFGTRLPRTSSVGGWVRVSVPPGRVLRVAAADVSLTASGAPARSATGSGLAASATTFVGLPYLWAGSSGFGLDCSGLVWLVHRVHGLTIPRDAGPQSSDGTRVDAARLAAGDLMFYASGGVVHHVTMYVGGGRMVHAPGTGSAIQTIPVSTASLVAEFVGARRYLR